VVLVVIFYAAIAHTSAHAQWQDWGGRILIWKAALHAMQDRWLVGYGLGNFEAGYFQHQVAQPVILHFEKSTIFAHNDFLQLGVEAGWPALLLLMWGLWGFFRSLPSLTTGLHRWALSVVVLFLVSSLFSFNFFLPFTGFLYAGCAGI